MIMLCIDSTDKETEIDGGDIHPEDYEITDKFEMVSRTMSTVFARIEAGSE